jgi:hypothetical protein
MRRRVGPTIVREPTSWRNDKLLTLNMLDVCLTWYNVRITLPAGALAHDAALSEVWKRSDAKASDASSKVRLLGLVRVPEVSLAPACPSPVFPRQRHRPLLPLHALRQMRHRARASKRQSRSHRLGLETRLQHGAASIGSAGVPVHCLPAPVLRLAPAAAAPAGGMTCD